LIEERLSKFTEDKEPTKLWSEPGKHDGKYGLLGYKYQMFMTMPVVSFIHPETLAFNFLGERKRLNPIKAYDIPYWGKVSDIIKIYYESNTE
jgi:hypothetical protein